MEREPLTLSAQCGEWASPIFDEVFTGVDVEASNVRFGKGYYHLAIAVLREEANGAKISRAARLLAMDAKNHGLRKFVQLDLPRVADSAARFTNPNGLSFRVCEAYQPPTVSEGGIAVPEMHIVRLDIAGHD